MAGVVVGQGRPAVPDAELEWAAEIWRANPPIRRAVSFNDFLAAPHVLIEAHLTPPPGWDAPGPPRRLLPAQRAAAHRLMLAERCYGPPPVAVQAAAERALPPGAVHRGDRDVEPLRHHSYRRSFHPERRRR